MATLLIEIDDEKSIYSVVLMEGTLAGCFKSMLHRRTAPLESGIRPTAMTMINRDVECNDVFY